MELQIHKYTGEKTTRKLKLSKEVFGIKPKEHAVYLDIKQILANKRQGTHKSKEKGEIKGSTRKLRKQKGSGSARVGSIKSPIFRGGGRIFGPRPRDYGFKLNAKLKKLARKSVLSDKAKSQNLLILEEFSFDAPKTKNYMAMLQAFSLAEEKTLLILPKSDKNIVLSGRNIPGVKIMTANTLNTYEMMHAKKMLIVESAIETITTQLS